MRRLLTTTLVFAFGAALAATGAHAQMMYPGGYGGFGMSRWGADPAAGYMAGLGAYARGQGVYELEKAKADAINLETMLKWNKALRARQLALREEKRKEAARRAAEAAARVAQDAVADGSTLNALLLQVLDSDPGVARSFRTRTPLSAAAIREIPFEWDSEAVTLCIDQMTGSGSLPLPLTDPRFDAERRALRAAVDTALKEDARGDISLATRKGIDAAVTAFRAAFLKASSEFDPGYTDAQDYFTTLAGLNRLLHDPSMKAFLRQLDDGRGRTVGDLIAFMNAFNLRFGPATSDRQIALYRRLIPALTAVRDASVSGGAGPSAPDATGEGLRSAARAAFRGLQWKDLEAHSRDQ